MDVIIEPIGILWVQYKLSSVNSICGMMLITTIHFDTFSLFSKQNNKSSHAHKVAMGLKLKEFTLKKNFADNLLTPMSSKISISFFLLSKRN